MHTSTPATCPNVRRPYLCAAVQTRCERGPGGAEVVLAVTLVPSRLVGDGPSNGSASPNGIIDFVEAFALPRSPVQSAGR